MPKEKMSATVTCPDGATGRRTITDLRFDSDSAWRTTLSVPAGIADAWMAHLYAECEERNWSAPGMAQHEAEENSGSLTAHVAPGVDAPHIKIAWEKHRNEDLHVRAGTGGSPPPTLEAVDEFLAAITERQRANKVKRAHRRAYVSYHGLAWRGELWLAEELCLSPPARFPPTTHGHQIVFVDAIVEGIGSAGVVDAFGQLLTELNLFLSIVARIRPDPIETVSAVWTYAFDASYHATEPELRHLGYWEGSRSPDMPVKGATRAIPRVPVDDTRLDQILRSAQHTELHVRDDAEALWDELRKLGSDRRQQFLQAGNAFMSARYLPAQQQTARAALMVVACEALKPPTRAARAANIYDVVEALLGRATSDRLRSLRLAPQAVRSAHFHHGTLAADELAARFGGGHFNDPSFGETAGELYEVTRKCFIEWLRRGGDIQVTARSEGRARRTKT